MGLGRFLLPGLLFGSVILTGCGSHPGKYDVAFVSPELYQSYSCRQLGQEMSRVEQRTESLYADLKSERTHDNWHSGLGLVFFWPTLFSLEGGDGPEAQEYAQLKGEYQALEHNVVAKSCAITARSPAEVIKSQEAQAHNSYSQTAG